tara:strand:- start:1420 stop:1593 length:174 start_codon:yes stop_codon:yes gene_type:complete
MKNLEKFGVHELNNQELIQIDGGSWRFIWKALEKIATALEIGDAIDEFAAGWNSVKC